MRIHIQSLSYLLKVLPTWFSFSFYFSTFLREIFFLVLHISYLFSSSLILDLKTLELCQLYLCTFLGFFYIVSFSKITYIYLFMLLCMLFFFFYPISQESPSCQ